MYCCSDNQRQTKSVTLTFKRSELIYDAENYSFVEGDIMKTDDVHARHQVFDIGQKGNIDRVTRVLNLAHAECVEMLFPYTKTEIGETQENFDNVLTAPEAYDIVLIHEYLVCRVLADWMSITNPGSQANWEGKFKELKSKIQTSLVSRKGKIRRKCKPF